MTSVYYSIPTPNGNVTTKELKEAQRIAGENKAEFSTVFSTIKEEVHIPKANKEILDMYGIVNSATCEAYKSCV